VRGNVHALHAIGPEILQIDFDLIIELHVIRHVDLDGAVSERLHHLVALELLVFRLVGVAKDHFINVRLRKLLGLDQMLLRRTKQVIQKCHIELQHFDEFDNPAIGDIELAVKVGRSYAELRLKPYRRKVKQAFLFNKYPVSSRLFCIASVCRWCCLYCLAKLYWSSDERFVRTLCAVERITFYRELLRVAAEAKEYRMVFWRHGLL